MKEKPDINELLSSFIDSELSERQKTEVQRLIAHDPEIAKRLQQLQKCRLLVASLPYELAPIDMAKQVEAVLERKALLPEQSLVVDERKGARHLMFRKVLTAAAMFVLAAILASVIYTIVTPEPTQIPMGFAGRLELKTHNLSAINSVIDKAIKNNGLTDSVTLKRQRGKNIYTLTCSRENLTLFLADLDNSWEKYDSATLFIETQTAQEPVVVNDVDAKQIIDVITPPKPRLTGEEKTTQKPPTQTQEEKKVHLTIIVESSE